MNLNATKAEHSPQERASVGPAVVLAKFLCLERGLPGVLKGSRLVACGFYYKSVPTFNCSTMKGGEVKLLAYEVPVLGAERNIQTDSLMQQQ